MAQKITVKQMMTQWALLPNRFAVNVLNFEVMMGRAARDIFKKSFYLQRFNAPGSPAWPQRTDHKHHSLLVETGSLLESIKFNTFQFAHHETIRVFTDPAELRHANRQDTYFCYAKLHNMGGRNAPHITGGARNIKQRQYMGDTSYIKDSLQNYSKIIFNGFPK